MEKKIGRDDLEQPEPGGYLDPSSDLAGKSPTAYDSDGGGDGDGDSSVKKKAKYTFVDKNEEYCRKLDRDLYRFGRQRMDTTNAVKMLYDVNDMLNLRIDPYNFAELIRVSSFRNCLNFFDSPGDPRLGGFYNISDVDRCNRSDFHVKPAQFAVDYYSTHCNPSAKIKFVRVEKVTCWPQAGDYFHYVTFRARDEVEEVEKIYQAIVLQYIEENDDDDDDDYYMCEDAFFVAPSFMERVAYCAAAAAAGEDNDCGKPPGDTKFMLGMLRIKDPDNDHVLGIIQLKPGVSRDDLRQAVRKH